MNDLLKILDMSKDEQRKAIARLTGQLTGHKFKSICKRSPMRGETPELWILSCEWCFKTWEHPTLTQIPEQDPKFRQEINTREPCQEIRHEGSLADLAFRLRDEVCSDPNGIDKYKRALHLIYRRWLDKQNGKARLIVTFTIWLIAFADPINEIIAALIAKEKE